MTSSKSTQERAARCLGALREGIAYGEQTLVRMRGVGADLLPAMILARAVTSSRAIVVLAEAGLYAEVYSCFRTLAELAIDVAWIWHDDTHAAERKEWFFEHFWVATELQDVALADAQGDENFSGTLSLHMLAPVPLNSYAEYRVWRKAEADRILQDRERWLDSQRLAAKNAGDPQNRRRSIFWKNSSWAPYSIYKRAQDAGKTNLYKTAYSSASTVLHSGPGAVFANVKLGQDGTIVHVAGRVAELPDVLTLTHAVSCFWLCVGYLLGAAGLQQHISDVEDAIDGFFGAGGEPVPE